MPRKGQDCGGLTAWPEKFDNKLRRPHRTDLATRV
jgi:hypothetical protein